MIKPKRRLVPLTDNDIMLAVLRNQHTVDRTQEYRVWLGTISRDKGGKIGNGGKIRERAVSERPKIDVEGLGIPKQMQIEQPLMELAGRLITELSGSQSQSAFKDRITLYQDTLKKVLSMHALSQQYYQAQVAQGQTQLHQLLGDVSQTLQVVAQSRRHNSIMKADLGVRAMRILHKIQITMRMKQVLSIVGVWRDGFLSNMAYFSEDRVYEFGVQKVLDVIQQTKSKFKANKNDMVSYGCFEKIGQFLDNKLSRIIAILTDSMTDSILNFNPVTYGKILLNYTYLVKHLDLYSMVNNLPLLLETNLNKILKDSFTQELNSIEKFETASGTEYLQFFERMLLKMEGYLHNWHLATRWHLESKEEGEFGVVVGKMGEEFLRFRKNIWAKSEEKIADMLSKSYRFYTISLNQRAMLMIKLYDFVRAGNFFASSHGKMIPKILKQKLRDQNELFLKQAMNLIKFALNKQLRCSIFQQLLSSLAIPQSYVCQLSPQQLTKLDQLINCCVPKHFQPTPPPPSPQYCDTQLQLPLPKSFTFQKNSSCCYLQNSIIQLAKRAYIQPKMSYELFLKCKQMLELMMYWMFRLMCSEVYRKQLVEDWTGLEGLRFNESRDVEMNQGVLEYFLECGARQGRCGKMRGEMQRIVGRLEVVGHKTIRREELPLSNVVFVNQNVCALLNWLKQNASNLFFNATEDQTQRIKSDLNELFDIGVQLAGYTYSSYFQDLKHKYQPIFAIVNELKWDVKKYNSDNAGIYREYKNKLSEIVAAQVTGLRELKYPQQINNRIQAGMTEVFFQALLDIYSKIEKVNENGRQLMRLDAIELAKGIESFGIPTSSSYKNHLDAFISLGFTRDPKDFQRNILQIQGNYPFRVWKNLINTAVCAGEMSSKQKRDLLLKIAQNYLQIIAKKRCK